MNRNCPFAHCLSSVSVTESALHPENVAHKMNSKRICLADFKGIVIDIS
jgi:hypothetical protein